MKQLGAQIRVLQAGKPWETRLLAQRSRDFPSLSKSPLASYFSLLIVTFTLLTTEAGSGA